MLFVAMDICILSQYAFLHFRNKWRREKAEKLGLIPPDTGYKEDENQSSGSESDDDMPQLQMDQYHPKEEVLYRTTGDAMTKNCEYQSKVSGSQALTTTQSASSTIYDANSDDAIVGDTTSLVVCQRRWRYY